MRRWRPSVELTAGAHAMTVVPPSPPSCLFSFSLLCAEKRCQAGSRGGEGVRRENGQKGMLEERGREGGENEMKAAAEKLNTRPSLRRLTPLQDALAALPSGAWKSDLTAEGKKNKAAT